MGDLLDDMIELENAAMRCIPCLASDPVLQKCEFKTDLISLLDVEYKTVARQKVVVLNSCGELGSYIAVILRELLAEEGIDAWVEFK